MIRITTDQNNIEVSFPKLMISQRKTIILAVGINKNFDHLIVGIVLKSETNEIGEYKTDLIRDLFQDYNGKIILKNI